MISVRLTELLEEEHRAIKPMLRILEYVLSLNEEALNLGIRSFLLISSLKDA